MKTFVVADIHGGLRSLEQCLTRCHFNYSEDRLIVLGDVCDGWPETYEVIELLLSLKNLVYIKGNHDADYRFSLYYLKNGMSLPIHYYQGGAATVESYENRSLVDKEKHRKFIESAPAYFEEGSRLFLHGGFGKKKEVNLDKIPEDVLMWDRELVEAACYNEYLSRRGTILPIKYGKWDEIYVGHTSTFLINEKLGFDSRFPIHACNVWLMDTGGGYEYKLSIMNIETKQVWQSDNLKDLYPKAKARSLK